MEKIKYFSKFSLLSKYNPVQNMLVTICWLTVSFIKIGPSKDIIFEGGGGGCTSPCGASILFHFCACVFYLKMVERNDRNILWVKQTNERAVFRCCVCVDSNSY